MIMHRATRHRMSGAGKVIAAAMLAAVALLPEVAERKAEAAAPPATVAAPAAAQAADVKSLQELIDKAKPGGEVTIPKGEWKQPLTITKPLKLRGEDRAACVIEVTSDQPALWFTHKGEASLEDVTVRWRLETSNRSQNPPAAVALKDGNLRMRNVRVVALDNPARCPSGFTAAGFGTRTAP
jgi:hypothetical protein